MFNRTEALQSSKRPYASHDAMRTDDDNDDDDDNLPIRISNNIECNASVTYYQRLLSLRFVSSLFA